MQQFRISLRGPVLPRAGGGLHRPCISAHNVHVLHIRRAGRHHADYVVDWKCKPDYFGAVIIWGSLDRYRQFCAVEVVYGLAASSALVYISNVYLVITSLLTIIFGVIVWFFFPDSPVNAKFLTHEERAQAILRIKENHSGIEQKTFKKYQCVPQCCKALAGPLTN